ncbi:hypothetical protein WJX77_007202 [Trebouxia sp. C0004]
MTDAQAQPISYIPSCSQQTHLNQYNVADAATYNPEHGGYYAHKVPVMLPGAIIGAVCLVAALAFLLWLLVLCCRPGTSWKQRKTKLWAPGTDKKGRRSATARLAIRFIILLLTLGVIGVGTWGLTDSIKNTNHQVDQAWDIASNASSTVQSIANLATGIFAELSQLSPTLVAVSKTLVGLGETIPLLNGVTSLTNEATSLNTTAASINSLVTSGTHTVSQIESKGVGNIEKIQNRYEHKTKVGWNPWRPVVIAVLFGLLIIFAVVAGCTAVSGRFPRTTAAFTLLLWIMTGIFFILGSGGLNGASHIAKDTCLYVETFVINTVARHSHNSSRALTAIDYYFGQLSIAPNDVPYEVYGINTTQLTSAVNSPAAQVLLGYLDTSAGEAFITNTAILSTTEQQQILALPTNLNQINSSIMALTNAIQVSAISPLYQNAKELVCCQVTDVLHRLWVAWAVTAVVAAVLAIFLTAKVITSVGPVSRGEYYSAQPTDSAAPGRGSMFQRNRHQPGQYKPGQYLSGQFIKSGADAKASAPPMEA